MRLAHDADEGVFVQCLEGDGFILESGVLDADDEVELIDGQPVQVGIRLVECQLWHDVRTFLQYRAQDLADQVVGVRVGVADAQHRAVLARNPFLGMVVNGEDLLCVGQELLPRRRECHGARRAGEESGLQLAFKALDLAGDSRL